MKRGARTPDKSAGFTIVETMIVLAVTGVLFAAIVGTWTGRQRANEFMTSSRDIRTRIQQIISEVQNGYFPNSGGFSCNVGMGLQLSDAPGQTQGSNDPCIFLGKVVQFGISGSGSEQYRVLSVAGARSTTSMAGAYPTVVAPDGLSNTSGLTQDLSEMGTLNYGLTVAKMVAGSGTSIQAIGFLSSLDSSDNGAPQVDVYGLLPGSFGGYDTSDGSKALAAAAVNNSFAGAIKNQPVKICFLSGGTHQYGLVTIGSGSGQLTTELTVMDTAGLATPCNI